MHWQAYLPKRARKQAAVRLCGALLVSFGSTTANAQVADRCCPQTPKRVLKIQNLSPVTQGRIFIRSREGVADPAWAGGRNGPRAPGRPEPPSVHRVRTGCGGRLFTAKLGIIVHDCMHQGFDQLLADQATLMAAPALWDGCNGLRTRSLKPRPVAVSNRRTVTPLSRAQLLHQVRTDAPVTGGKVPSYPRLLQSLISTRTPA